MTAPTFFENDGFLGGINFDPILESEVMRLKADEGIEAAGTIKVRLIELIQPPHQLLGRGADVFWIARIGVSSMNHAETERLCSVEPTGCDIGLRANTLPSFFAWVVDCEAEDEQAFQFGEEGGGED